MILLRNIGSQQHGESGEGLRKAKALYYEHVGPLSTEPEGHRGSREAGSWGLMPRPPGSMKPHYCVLVFVFYRSRKGL